MASKIRIDQITIPPRRRKQFSDVKLQDLADSIKATGLVHPIVIEKMVDGSYKLLVGERRIRAHQLLGLEEIEFNFKENLSEIERKQIELDENIHREDLTWQEEAVLQEDIHNLYQEMFGKTHTPTLGGPILWKGGWRISDTADLIGENKATVVINLQLAKGMRENPDLAKKETREAAYKAMKVGSELDLLRGIAGILAQTADEAGEEAIQIINGDSAIELKKFEEESFDFCITDPEYGIGFHDMQQTFPNRGEVRQGVEFDDSKGRMVTELPTIFKEVYRLLKPNSHCYVFFAIARYTEVRDILEGVGFWVCHTPLFWIKNNALNLRPHIMFPVNYEPIFYCAKGYPPRPFPVIQQKSTFDYPILGGSTKVHPAEKPLELIKQLMGLCSQPNERGLDPFLGGGTFTRALKEMGRRGIGIELDQTWWMQAKIRLEKDET